MSRLPQQDLDHIFRYTETLWEELRGQSVFLTGGTGFVGTWLLESLLWATDKLNLRVTVVVLTRHPERFSERSPHLAGHPATRLLRGSMVGFDAPAGAFPIIIHAATEHYFEPDAERPLAAFYADVEGTRAVLEFARRHSVRRLLCTSSGAVYGRQPSEMTHISEEYAGAPSTIDTGSAYGQAKRVSEFMSVMYSRVYGFDAIIARLFAFVGPLLPLDANYAVGNFIRDVLRGGPVRIAGDGTPYRSYLYAADLAVWLWTILLRGEPARPYNVGSTEALTIAQLAQAVAGDRAIEIARGPVRGAPALRYVPSTKRAQVELGLQQWVPLSEGIERTMEWHRRSN